MSSRKCHAIENLCRLVLPFPWNFPYTFSAKPWSWSFAALLFYIDRRRSHLNQTPHNNSQSWISLTKFILSGVQLAEHTRYNYPNSSIKPPPPHPRGLFFWKHLGGRGGGGLNLAKTMVSVLCNTKWKSSSTRMLEVTPPSIKSQFELPVGELTISDQSTRSFTVVID